MDCVTAQQLIKPYLEGYLSDKELEEFLDHVQTCPNCFDELEVYFSVYRTLENVDEKGDYDFRRKLRAKMEGSRAYLLRRNQGKVIRTSIILGAEFALAASFWGFMGKPVDSGPAGMQGYEASIDTAEQKTQSFENPGE